MSLEVADTPVAALAANGARYPGQPAMRWHDGAGWQVLTWAGYAQAVREVALGLADLGLGGGEHVAILSANRPEWHLADLGAMAAGCVTVPVYLTSSAAQIAYQLGHAEVRACFVDGHESLGKLLEAKPQLPKLDFVVLFDATRRADDTFVLSFAELRARGRERQAVEPGAFDRQAQAIEPSSVATIVYTSGTTGPPKGAMISHENIMWTLRNVPPAFDVGPGERLLSFLPLSHIAERMMSEMLPLAVCGETWFARSLATVVEDLPACRPTVFLTVPRVWEKLQEGILEQVAAAPAPLRTLLQRYLATGARRFPAAAEGAAHGTAAGAVPRRLTDAEYRLWDQLLGAQLRKRLGLDQAHALVSAAAPIHPDLLRWFHGIGLAVAELYGQTEDCGPTTANRPADNRIGTVGRPLPGVRVRVNDDGEILVKGGNVCLGYLKDPESTAALIDPDGWMHSGDLGALEADGRLRVTGRKKDLIITAAGKNVAPQGIELDLREHPLISQALVVGEGRRYLTALLTLDSETLLPWASRHGKLADAEALAADPDVVAEVQAAIDAVNARRSHAEGIRRFRILAHDLTVAGGELTPTLKVKRAEVYAKYADVIGDLYSEDA